MFKMKLCKSTYYDNIIGLGYSTTRYDYENNNEINIYLPFKCYLTITLPPFFKGKKDKYGDLHNNGFYISFDREKFYMNWGTDTNEKDRSYIYYEYPWSYEYVKNSKVFLNHNDNTILKNINEDNIWEFDWNKNNKDLIKFYNIIDPYTGNKLLMKCYVERISHKRGKGIFKKLFNTIFKVKHYHRLEMYFEKEFGEGVSSWKGGTLNQSIYIPNYENIHLAVKYSCDKTGIKFYEEIYED